MKLKEFVSHIFDYRIKESELGWDEAVQVLSKNGDWSLSASPKKFEKIILELCKRVERLEENEKNAERPQSGDNQNI